jgi:hypothetical protein
MLLCFVWQIYINFWFQQTFLKIIFDAKKTRTFPGQPGFQVLNQNITIYNTNTGRCHPFTMGSKIETVTCAMAADGNINHNVNPVW